MNNFIVFEGADGVGKTTILKMFANLLEEDGYKVSIINYGYKPIDDTIKALRNDRKNYDPKAHFLLALSNSIMTYQTFIRPALELGHIVILDRYYFTTIAYNVALGLNEEWVNEVVNCIPNPDKVFYIYSSIENQILRKQSQFEDIELGFNESDKKISSFILYQERVKSVYERQMTKNPELFVPVDNNSGIEEAVEYVKKYTLSLVKKNGR